MIELLFPDGSTVIEPETQLTYCVTDTYIRNEEEYRIYMIVIKPDGVRLELQKRIKH